MAEFPRSFNQSLLFVSARSPFARRVRLAFLEHGVDYEEKVVDVFKPQPELTRYNPLARVPTLVLGKGQVLVDSHLILETLYEKGKSSWIPEKKKDRLLARYWSAIATGFCDKIVEYYLETLRPKEKRDPEVLQEVAAIAERTLAQIDRAVRGRESIVGKRLSQADLDLGTALAYCSLRFSTEWQKSHRDAFRYFQQLDRRPSFERTRPPAPTA